ncbi:PREDICTED: bZIP transcription factor 60 [Theobroma cacao]|uniref:BZIP transcription factor 60 n=1 Tax=Theobroma cacao TaxID=3641 RepID=A0AB32WWD7_THECC|nr:PREDICTED: bZIP transcription factor 60 [Theobroma cacao]XP_017981824.1 PREDICTED: bZIP transcription factor 60 [Theobroma cacao]
MEGDLETIGEINWDTLFLELDSSDFANIFENSSNEPEPVTQPLQPLSTPSPDGDAVVSSCIGEIERVLMEDDDFDKEVQTQSVSDDFLAEVLVDSPLSGGGEVIDAAAADVPDAADVADVADASFFKQNDSDNNIHSDDHIAKKRRRQLRNRDAAVRSRERKKMHVKDLEMKSRYLEGECRRLSRMLQCFIAENQALRLTLHKGCAFDASSAKQESAVLLLESLLLGSLLWFLGIMCLFTLPTLPKSLPEAVPLENEEKRGPERVAPRGAGSNLVGQSFVKSRRCKASKTRIKEFHVSGILARACGSHLSLVFPF